MAGAGAAEGGRCVPHSGLVGEGGQPGADPAAGGDAWRPGAAQGYVELMSMDQISITTPNPKCRLFFKIDQYLAASVYLSEVHDPPPLSHTCHHVLIHTGKGGRVDKPVTKLEGH
jgi:hypothetical protein